MKYVWSLNFARRHLTSSQAAACSLEYEKQLAEEAKERQKLSEGRGKKGKEKIPDLNQEKGQARDQAAAATGTNARYVSEAKKLAETAPDLLCLLLSTEISAICRSVVP